jgi:hypothetical protein
MVRDAKVAVSFAGEKSRPPQVVSRIIMCGSVDFDDQASVGAVEVDDIWTQGNLAAPFPSAESAVSKHTPQQRLGARASGAKLARPFGEPPARH